MYTLRFLTGGAIGFWSNQLLNVNIVDEASTVYEMANDGMDGLRLYEGGTEERLHDNAL